MKILPPTTGENNVEILSSEILPSDSTVCSIEYLVQFRIYIFLGKKSYASVGNYYMYVPYLLLKFTFTSTILLVH